MGKKEINITKSLQLLEARKEALEKQRETSMKSHGKIRGADCFSWHGPNIEALANTILNFPYPIVWLTPIELLTEVNEFLRHNSPNFKAIVCHGEPNGQQEFHEDLFDMYYVEDAATGLKKVQSILNKECMLLVTGDLQDEKHHLTLLEHYKLK